MHSSNMPSETSMYSILPEEKAELQNQNITTMSEIQDFHLSRDLKVLNLEKNKITVIDNFISQFKYLKFLNLASNKINKIQNLSSLSDLTLLDIHKNKIPKLENLENNIKLKRLLISNNIIQTIELKSPLSNLIILDIHKNPIQKLNFGANFPKLERLDINECLLKSLKGIDTFPCLKKLNCKKNQIKDSPSLVLSHRAIEEIDISDNLITLLTPFLKLSSLTQLNLSNNKITNESFKIPQNINEVPKLKILNVSGTQIESIYQIFKLFPNIEFLDASNCQISDMKDVLSFVKSSKKLKNLNLLGNPLTNDLYPKEFTSNKKEMLHSISVMNKRDKNSIEKRRNYRNTILQNTNGNLETLDRIKAANEYKSSQKSTLLNSSSQDFDDNNSKTNSSQKSSQRKTDNDDGSEFLYEDDDIDNKGNFNSHENEPADDELEDDQDEMDIQPVAKSILKDGSTQTSKDLLDSLINDIKKSEEEKNQKEIDDLKVNENEIQKLNDKIKKLKDDRNHLTEEIKKANENINELNTKNDELEKNVIELKDKNASLNETMEKMDKKCLEIQDSLEKEQNENEKLNEDIQKAKEEIDDLNSLNQDNQTKISSLENDIKDKESCIDELNQDNKKQMETILQMKNENEKLANNENTNNANNAQEVQELKNLIEEKEKEIQRLNDELKEVNHLKTQVTEQEQSNQTLKNDLEDKNMKIQELENSINQKDQEIENLKIENKSDNINKDSEHQISELKEENEKLKDKIKFFEQEKDDFTQKIEELTKKIEEKESNEKVEKSDNQEKADSNEKEEILSLKAQINDLQEKMKKMDEENSSLRKLANQKEEEIKIDNDKKIDLNDAKKLIGAKKEAMDKNISENVFNKIFNKLKENEDNLQKIKSKISPLTTKIKELNKEKDDFKNQIEELNKLLTKANEDNESLSAKIKELSEANESLSEKIKESKEANEPFSAKNKELSETNESLSEKIKELSEANESLSAKNKELSETNESLSAKIKELSEANESLSAKNKELKEENESLSAKIKELKEAISNQDEDSKDKKLREYSQKIDSLHCLIDKLRKQPNSGQNTYPTNPSFSGLKSQLSKIKKDLRDLKEEIERGDMTNSIQIIKGQLMSEFSKSNCRHHEHRSRNGSEKRKKDAKSENSNYKVNCSVQTKITASKFSSSEELYLYDKKSLHHLVDKCRENRHHHSSHKKRNSSSNNDFSHARNDSSAIPSSLLEQFFRSFERQNQSIIDQISFLRETIRTSGVYSNQASFQSPVQNANTKTSTNQSIDNLVHLMRDVLHDNQKIRQQIMSFNSENQSKPSPKPSNSTVELNSEAEFIDLVENISNSAKPKKSKRKAQSPSSPKNRKKEFNKKARSSSFKSNFSTTKNLSFSSYDNEYGNIIYHENPTNESKKFEIIESNGFPIKPQAKPSFNELDYQEMSYNTTEISDSKKKSKEAVHYNSELDEESAQKIQYPSHLNPHISTSSTNSPKFGLKNNTSLSQGFMNIIDCESVILKEASSENSELIENSDEFKSVKFWLSVSLRKDIVIKSIIKFNSTNDFVKLNPIQPFVVLLPVEALDNEEMNPNSKINIQKNAIVFRYLSRIPKSFPQEFFLCATDFGIQFVQNNQRFEKPSQLDIDRIQKEGYDSFIFNLKGIEHIMIFSPSRIVPLYYISI